MTTHIEFNGIKFASADEAIQHAEASGRGKAIGIDNQWYVADQSECDRLEAAGVVFRYAFLNTATDGSDRVVMVSVNG